MFSWPSATCSTALQSPSNVYLREEHGIEDPAGLTIYRGLQIALYTHPCQAGRTSSNRPEVETPDYPAPA
jgi:hypothetical protein